MPSFVLLSDLGVYINLDHIVQIYRGPSESERGETADGASTSPCHVAHAGHGRPAAHVDGPRAIFSAATRVRERVQTRQGK